ncbi:hypothetical protein PGT21_019961 [Puccinia graminis f. sp. tritici]|uniref:Uncharacterized protein n=1 Tax=Puccinia graminis f. sp. tritici TaxID=56615 RepID=A0A5B0NT14_PUCGR|nr:hypothetical protein PGT21_019961 [Puccinia graminis f. sp. tritici]KAA1125564.1 hypothetical protein PGTUg99_019936 [Puccinia graminis f. sp. tritici]
MTTMIMLQDLLILNVVFVALDCHWKLFTFVQSMRSPGLPRNNDAKDVFLTEDTKEEIFNASPQRAKAETENTHRQCFRSFSFAQILQAPEWLPLVWVIISAVHFHEIPQAETDLHVTTTHEPLVVNADRLQTSLARPSGPAIRQDLWRQYASLNRRVGSSYTPGRLGRQRGGLLACSPDHHNGVAPAGANFADQPSCRPHR